MRWLLYGVGYLVVMCAVSYLAGRVIAFGQRGMDGED